MITTSRTESQNCSFSPESPEILSWDQKSPKSDVSSVFLDKYRKINVAKSDDITKSLKIPP